MTATERPSLVFYSDCPVFGGADMVVARLLSDERLGAAWSPVLLYRDNPSFRAGVAARLPAGAKSQALSFPERLEWIETLESRGLPAAFLLAAKVLFRLLECVFFPYEAARLFLAFRRLRPRLVHVNDGGYPGALGCRAAAVAARLAGARVVFAVHNQASPRRAFDLLDALIDPLVSRCVDVFATASTVSQNALARRGFARKRMVIVPDGVPLPAPGLPRSEVRAELGVADGDVVFVMTSFFEPRKGHAVLLEALRLLAEDPAAPRFTVVLIGDGPTRPEIERTAAATGLSDRLRFLGYRKDAAQILDACDAMALPSIHSEDMPLAILDAMALGKPVVSTRLAAIPEEVDDGRTGLLAEPGNARSLAVALGRLAGDSELRRRLGEAGRVKYNAEFRVSTMCGRYLDLYAKTL